MPQRISRSMASKESTAGPSVQTILVRRLPWHGDADIEPVIADYSDAISPGTITNPITIPVK